MQSRRGTVRSIPRTLADRAPLAVSPRSSSTIQAASDATVQPTPAVLSAEVVASSYVPSPATPPSAPPELIRATAAPQQAHDQPSVVLFPELNVANDGEATASVSITPPALPVEPQPSLLPPPLPVELVMRDIPPSVLAAKVAVPATVKPAPLTAPAVRRLGAPLQDITSAPQLAPKPAESPRLNVESVGVRELSPVLADLPAADKRGNAKIKNQRKSKKAAGGAKRKPLLKRLFGRSSATTALIIIILGATTYIGVDTWLTNSKLKSQLSTPVAMAASQPSPDHQAASEGTDASPLPANTLANYKVAADLPRALTIEKLGVSARVMPMGVNADGSMQAPININDSGWYTDSAKPGAPGAMLIDGHSTATNSAAPAGLFNKLDTLSDGDVITVERGNGEKVSYRVVFKETVKLDAVDMDKALLPYGAAREGLNLITCSGQWVNKDTTLDHRTIVYTERIHT